MTFQFIDYLHNYLILQPRHQNWYRKPEMQEEAYLIKNNFSKYEEIYVAKNEAEPIYYYYFFNNLDPISILKNKTKKNLGDWSDGKIHFIHDQCVHAINNNKNNLLIENSACESGGKIIKYIYGSDGRKALVVKQTKYKKINEN